MNSSKQDLSRYSDVYIGTEALFFTLVDSAAVYRVEIDYFSQKIDLNKGEPCESMVMAILNERFMKKHLMIFQDVKILCGVVLFAHGNVLSVFDFSRENWTHHILKGDDKSNSPMFFG